LASDGERRRGRTSGRSSSLARADVADSRAVHDAIASVVSEAGRLDVVVNNDGIFRFAPLDQTTEDLSS